MLLGFFHFFRNLQDVFSVRASFMKFWNLERCPFTSWLILNHLAILMPKLQNLRHLKSSRKLIIWHLDKIMLLLEKQTEAKTLHFMNVFIKFLSSELYQNVTIKFLSYELHFKKLHRKLHGAATYFRNRVIDVSQHWQT